MDRDADFTSFDPAELNAITGEDPELQAELIALFLGNAPSQLEAVRQAVAGRRFDDIMQSSHKLKGALLTVAARPSARLALALEQAARARSLSGLDETLTMLERAMARLSRALSPKEARK